MRTILIKDVRLRPRLKKQPHRFVQKPVPFSAPVELENKNSYRWKKGDELDIRPAYYASGRQCNSKVIVRNITRGAKTTINAEDAHNYSEDFISWDDDDLMRATFDGACPSLTGANVEPDGTDSYGFPSIISASMF